MPTTRMVAEIICYDVSWHLGPKYSSRVISNLNQRLLLLIPKSERRQTNRQTDKKTGDYYNPLDMHAEG